MPITPLPPVPGVIKCEIVGTSNSGLLWANVLHWQYSGPPPSGAVLDSWATTMFNLYVAQFLPVTVPDVSLEFTLLTDLSSNMGLQGAHVAHQPGTSAGDKISGQVCTLVKFPIVNRYRGGHPRMYMTVGEDANLQDMANWNDAWIADMTTRFAGFQSNFADTPVGPNSTTDQCAVSYFGGAPTVLGKSVRRLVPVILQIAENFIIEKALATQRRRVRG
jgi:hypothetical protein